MSQELILILVIPIILIFIVLWLCKRFNFTILPPDLRGDNIKNVSNYQWFSEKNNQDKL